MLDAGAELKGFALHGDAVPVEPAESLTGGVAESEEDRVGFENVSRLELDAADATAVHDEARHAGGETKLGAKLDHPPPHPAHHRRQEVAADVRLGVIEDRTRRTTRGENLENLAHPGVADSGVELAIGVGAGAALTEEQIALGVEGFAAKKSVPPPGAFGDIGAAFDHDGCEAHLDQTPGGEETRGSGADDHWRSPAVVGREFPHLHSRRRLIHLHRRRMAVEQLGFGR